MRYNPDNCTIETSVRSLCALACKSGDIDSRRKSGNQQMILGGELHRKLQAEAGGYYNPEVTLYNTTLFDGVYYSVSGRADGIIRTEQGLCVDEIKCVRSYEFYMPPRSAHLCQLKCYAYFLCVRDELDVVDARLTYYNVDKNKIKYFNYRFTKAELKKFYLSLLLEASFFAGLHIHRHLDVLPKAARAVFPYSQLREGQEMMIRESYCAIKRSKRIFIEAPTGTGKTISSIFPALRALGEGRADKIFYLTAKASTRREAYAAAAKLFRSGVAIKAIVLNSKENMCRCKSSLGSARNLCNPDDCPFARGYYDRVNGALRELLSEMNGYPSKAILSVAEKYAICPYELSLDLSEYCDIIICDYNYAFDPSVYLRRYFSDEGKREKYVFLIDEAHNLADRARDMYSAELRLSDFTAVNGLLTENDGDITSCILSVISAFQPLRKLCRDNVFKDGNGEDRGFFMSRSPLSHFTEELESFRKKCDTWLRKNEHHEIYDQAYALASAVRKYLCVSEYFDKGFLCYVELGGGDITVKTYCLDPSAVMNGLLARACSAVMFSATLTPSEYFCDVLGSAKGSVSVSLPSPFEPENLCVAVADFVSTRYEDRDASIQKYVCAIAATVSAKAGNYIVYFPSYDCLEKVKKVFCKKYPQVETVVQERGMRSSEKEAFLSKFKEDKGRLRVGFCVLGGAFSEGVDLPGSRLIGVIVIGVGLPGLSNERNIIKEYFDVDSGCGYDYAYTYPGMNNVLQAAGRVIRTDSDKGVVVLVDDRYATPKYRGLFPKHWRNIQYAGNFSSLAEIARRFWKNKV